MWKFSTTIATVDSIAEKAYKNTFTDIISSLNSIE